MSEETRRVKFTDPVTRLGDQTYVEDDEKTLPKWLADICIENGWGRDADTGDQGPRVAGAKTISVNPVTQVTGFSEG
jgi:hypothetical protein